MRWKLVFPTLLLATLPACDRQGEPAEIARDQAAIDRLRALPYASSTRLPAPPRSDFIRDYDPARSFPGATLITTLQSSLAELYARDGSVLRSWSHAPSRGWSNAELITDGDVLAQGTEDQHRTYLLRLDWDGHVLRKKYTWVHHDMEEMADGRIALLARGWRVIPAIDPEREVIDNQVRILESSGKFAENHSLYDMLAAAPEVFAFQDVKPRRGRIDLFHANSLEFMHHRHLMGRHGIYAEGNVLVCSRHQDSVFIFDISTGKAVWAWGQGLVSGPHDASVLENGNILLFDNGLGRGSSRVIELDPLRRKIVWEYRADPPGSFYSHSRGSAQRLPNGNTLITNSNSGEVFEVTREGEVVWRFLNPNADTKGNRRIIARAKRYWGRELDALLARPALARPPGE